MSARQACGDEDVGEGVEDVDEGGFGDHGGEDVGPVGEGGGVAGGHEGEEEAGGDAAEGGDDEEDAVGD